MEPDAGTCGNAPGIGRQVADVAIDHRNRLMIAAWLVVML
jgi:hypothetical protein